MKKSLVLPGIVLFIVIFTASHVFATTIVVDGIGGSNWNNADVALSPDKSTDAPAGDANANIIDTYITSDSSNLYVRFDVAGTVFASGTNFMTYIDTDNNPATGESQYGIGADYRIHIGGSGGSATFWGVEQYSGGWTWVAAPTFGNAGSVFEISASLASLGSPSGIVAIHTYSQVTSPAYVNDWNNDVIAGAGPILHTIGGTGISIDGVIGDWDGTEVIANDPDDSASYPDTVDMREAGISSDSENLYVRLTVDDTALWGTGYKEYRMWIDTSPLTTNGYQPYFDPSDPDPLDIAWPDFYADYQITIATYGTVDELINQEIYQNCSIDDCSQSPPSIPQDAAQFDAAVGSDYIEYKIPLTNIGNPDPDCIEIALTTYDADTDSGDSFHDWGENGIATTPGCNDNATVDVNVEDIYF